MELWVRIVSTVVVLEKPYDVNRCHPGLIVVGVLTKPSESKNLAYIIAIVDFPVPWLPVKMMSKFSFLRTVSLLSTALNLALVFKNSSLASSRPGRDMTLSRYLLLAYSIFFWRIHSFLASESSSTSSGERPSIDSLSRSTSRADALCKSQLPVPLRQ